MSFGIVKDTLTPGLTKFFKVDAPKAIDICMLKIGLQLLNNCNNGSPQDPTVPPKDTGALRSSASVFLDDKLIGIAPYVGGEATPAKSFPVQLKSGEHIVTIVYNTAYAAKLHETEWNLGEGSVRAGNVGNFWIKKHLDADGKELIKFFGILLKKELFKG